MKAIHVAVGQKAIRKQRKQDKLWQSEELVPRECEACATTVVLACASNVQHIQAYRRSSVRFSSAPPNAVLIGAGPPCCTCVMIPPAADMTYKSPSTGLDPSVYGGGGSLSSESFAGSFVSLGSAALVSPAISEGVTRCDTADAEGVEGSAVDASVERYSGGGAPCEKGGGKVCSLKGAASTEKCSSMVLFGSDMSLEDGRSANVLCVASEATLEVSSFARSFRR